MDYIHRRLYLWASDMDFPVDSPVPAPPSTVCIKFIVDCESLTSPSTICRLHRRVAPGIHLSSRPRSFPRAHLSSRPLSFRRAHSAFLADLEGRRPSRRPDARRLPPPRPIEGRPLRRPDDAGHPRRPDARTLSARRPVDEGDALAGDLRERRPRWRPAARGRPSET
ncbi:hypothetical protein BD626DRAFT_33697 [Schizophyllum amplum]|uniref:Uncharacterized protein n=1 Tax=Schizophyllum amplum TaxID=97359 RepID=A0A550CEC9_9AGAR|nr:hypothetical protein BD626DRAFT_33697 [Auriculariopsis ampla]